MLLAAQVSESRYSGAAALAVRQARRHLRRRPPPARGPCAGAAAARRRLPRRLRAGHAQLGSHGPRRGRRIATVLGRRFPGLAGRNPHPRLWRRGRLRAADPATARRAADSPALLGVRLPPFPSLSSLVLTGWARPTPPFPAGRTQGTSTLSLCRWWLPRRGARGPPRSTTPGPWAPCPLRPTCFPRTRLAADQPRPRPKRSCGQSPHNGVPHGSTVPLHVVINAKIGHFLV